MPATRVAMMPAMITVDYLHLCDYACVMQNGKPCLVGVFDRIYCRSFPAVHPLICVAVNFVGPRHTRFPVTISIVGPTGADVASVDAEAATNANGLMFINANLFGMIFPATGAYTVKVSSRGEDLATKQLLLLPIDPQSPAGGSRA